MQKAGVGAIVVAALGMSPMQGFNQVGITVYFADQNQLQDVMSVIEGLKEN